MNAIRIPVHSILSEAGSFIVGEDKLHEKSYEVGPDSYELEDGISIDYTLSNVGDAILLAGTARGRVHTECARCLKPLDVDIAGDLEGYYLIDPEKVPEDMEEGEFFCVLPDESVDIADAVLAALVIETPVAFLCKDDCKGLCPRCGADLNEGPCGCKPDDIDPSNPFSVLKDLFDDGAAAGGGAGSRPETEE